MLEPRPYQTEALEQVLKCKKEGVYRQLIALPTGCGKTIIFGMVAEKIRTHTLILAHREELLRQAEQKIKLVYPTADTGIFQGQEKSGLHSEICIASVQTASRHIKELKDRDFNLLICDEAHHAPSQSYKTVFFELGFMEEGSKKLLLGVTATPYRKDNSSLGDIFQYIVFERSIPAMMTAGYLCPVKGVNINTGTDISAVKLEKGDFAINELAQKIDTPVRNQVVVENYIKYGENRHGIIFCVNVEHAQHLATVFHTKGISCEAVYGNMPSDKRRNVLEKYDKHEIQLLTNVGVLTEGWDSPDTDLVMMTKPTCSKSFYIQCIGRGLRLAPTKKDCLLIDFVDNSKKYKLYGFGELFKDVPIKTENPYEGKEGGGFYGGYDTFIPYEERDSYIPKVDVKEFNPIDTSVYVWQPVGKNYKLPLLDGSSLWCNFVENENFTPLLVSSSGESKILSSMKALPVGYTMGVCEDYARKHKIGSFFTKIRVGGKMSRLKNKKNFCKKSEVSQELQAGKRLTISQQTQTNSLSLKNSYGTSR